MQTSASIQKGTSPLKFDHFRSKIPILTASNLSIKVRPAGRARPGRGLAQPLAAPAGWRDLVAEPKEAEAPKPEEPQVGIPPLDASVRTAVDSTPSGGFKGWLAAKL